MESGRINPTNSSSIETVSILVVDDDITCLAIVAAILKKFKYEAPVVTVKHPNDALCTLRIKGGAFDLVVSDVHMPDMNGFELQRAITQEFNLPVVLMSADDKEGVALKGLESGAAFFIMKPITPDDLRDLWQFAAMKRKDINVFEEKAWREKYIDSDELAVSASSVNEDHAKTKSPKKERRDDKNGENSQSCSHKRPKIVWTNSLHNRFLEAIRSIGLDRAVPKKILEVMNVPGLTRENVASHLQKYRIFLRRVSDASYKIQYSSSSSSSHKSLTSRNLKLNSESSRISTLMPSTLSKLTYQNPNAEVISSSSALTTQSRLLSNRGRWQNPSVIRTSNLVPCHDHDSSPRSTAAQNYCGARASINSHLASITLEDQSNAMSHAFLNSTSDHYLQSNSTAANDLDLLAKHVGNSDSFVAREQLCDAIADYGMPLLPLVAQESAPIPVFDMSEFDMLSPQQGYVGIQNKPQPNNGGGSSNLYGDMLHWDSCVNVPYSFHQPQNQIQSNQLSNTQGFTTSSQLNGTVLLPTNEEVHQSLANSLEFGTYTQLSKINVGSPTHERNDDDFLEYLLAPFAEDHSLEGSNL